MIQFQKRGFLEVRFDSLVNPEPNRFHAYYNLGTRWRTLHLKFSESDFSNAELKAVGVKPDNGSFVVPIEKLEYIMERLSRLKSDSGSPFASVQLRQLQKLDEQTLIAQLILTNTAPRTIDGIEVKGYPKFPKSFLRYYAGVRKGRTFRKQKLIQQNEVLDQLGFVRSPRPPEALFKKDSTVVYFYLEKTNNNAFDGILGFATNEETQKLEFNGYLSLDLNNNLNFGEQLKIDYKADGREQQNFMAFTKWPYLFRSPFGLSLELKIFKRDSTFSTTHQEARVYYQTSPTTQFYAGYKGYESNNLLDEPLAGSTVRDYNSDFLVAGGDFSLRQSNRFFPVKTLIRAEAEIGTRDSQAGSENQWRLEWTAGHIFNLNFNNAIYIGTSGGLLESNSYLTNELFRFGGVNNIRGFNENSIDASLYTVINSEYRYLFNNNLFINSIIDFSYFENQVLDRSEKLYSFGFGLGLNTNAGILKLYVANGIAQNQDPDFAKTKIHLLWSASF